MLLTALAVFISAFFAILLAFYVTYRLVMPKIVENVARFVSSPDGTQPSQLALIVESAARSAGRAIAMEVKTTIMGKASVASRQETALMADMATDAINNANPILGTALDMFPTVKKRLTKNPALLEGLMGMLSKSGALGGNGSNHSSAPITKVDYGKYK
jgi:hypothetical protein